MSRITLYPWKSQHYFEIYKTILFIFIFRRSIIIFFAYKFIKKTL